MTVPFLAYGILAHPRTPVYAVSHDRVIHEENIALKVCLCQQHTAVTGKTQGGWQRHKLASLRWFLTVCAEILWGRDCISRRCKSCCGPGIARFARHSYNYTNVMLLQNKVLLLNKLNKYVVFHHNVAEQKVLTKIIFNFKHNFTWHSKEISGFHKQQRILVLFMLSVHKITLHGTFTGSLVLCPLSILTVAKIKQLLVKSLKSLTFSTQETFQEVAEQQTAASRKMFKEISHLLLWIWCKELIRNSNNNLPMHIGSFAFSCD